MISDVGQVLMKHFVSIASGLPEGRRNTPLTI